MEHQRPQNINNFAPAKRSAVSSFATSTAHPPAYVLYRCIAHWPVGTARGDVRNWGPSGIHAGVLLPFEKIPPAWGLVRADPSLKVPHPPFRNIVISGCAEAPKRLAEKNQKFLGKILRAPQTRVRGGSRERRLCDDRVASSDERSPPFLAHTFLDFYMGCRQIGRKKSEIRRQIGAGAAFPSGQWLPTSGAN